MPGADLLLVGVLCAGVLFVQGVGRLQILLGICFFGLFLLPSVVYGGSALDADWVGIAGAEPRVMTYSIAVAAVVGYGLIAKGASMSWSVVHPLMGYCVLWYALFWGSSPKVQAGLLHLLTAGAAWLAGVTIARMASRRTNGLRIIAAWVLAWATFQAVVCLAQFAGSPIYPRANGPTEDATLAGRIGGTLGHPSTIGKAVVLLLMVALPWLNSYDRVLRRRAATAMVLMIVPLVLSGGRANAAAAVAMVVLALVLEPGPRRWSRRARLAAVLLVTGLLSAGYWVQRFATGENGETREHLTTVAVQFMHHHWNWVTGTGPNTYVGVVGSFDRLTAQGWPVHNLYLLAGIELGLVGAVLLALPFLHSVVVGWSGRRQSGVSGAQARVLVAAVPGMLLITATGWGMLSNMLPAWFFTLGYCVDQAGRGRRRRVRLRANLIREAPRAQMRVGGAT